MKNKTAKIIGKEHGTGSCDYMRHYTLLYRGK